MRPTPLERATRVHQALGDPTRLRILVMLRGGELCVCQVTAVLRLAPATVSAHLAELRRAGLVRDRKDRCWVRYALATTAAVRTVWDSTWPQLARDPQVLADRTILRRIRDVPVEQLCAVESEIDRLATAASRGAGRETITWAARTG